MPTRPMYGLVLAGGKSRRMGQDKAALKRGDETQLEFLMALVGGYVERTFLSTRSANADDALRQQFPQIVDRYQDMGPIAGILSALEEYPNVDWLVVACDLPNISGETVAHLIEQYDGTSPFAAYISSHDGLPEPLCAIYATGSDRLLKAFADDGINCPRKMLIRSATQLVEQLDPSSLDNVNTPEDLHVSILRAAE